MKPIASLILGAALIATSASAFAVPSRQDQGLISEVRERQPVPDVAAGGADRLRDSHPRA